MAPITVGIGVGLLELPFRIANLLSSAQFVGVFPGEIPWKALQLMDKRVIEEIECSVFLQVAGLSGEIQLCNTIWTNRQFIDAFRQDLQQQRLLRERGLVY